MKYKQRQQRGEQIIQELNFFIDIELNSKIDKYITNAEIWQRKTLNIVANDNTIIKDNKLSIAVNELLNNSKYIEYNKALFILLGLDPFILDFLIWDKWEPKKYLGSDSKNGGDYCDDIFYQSKENQFLLNTYCDLATGEPYKKIPTQEFLAWAVENGFLIAIDKDGNKITEKKQKRLEVINKQAKVIQKNNPTYTKENIANALNQQDNIKKLNLSDTTIIRDYLPNYPNF